MDAVTGAFSYTGSFIAQALLDANRQVTSLSRRAPPPDHPLAERVAYAPLSLDDERQLVRTLTGVEVLYNTFWIRFPRDDCSFEWAIAASARLFRAAADAGVRRIVHVSITNPSVRSPFAYFRAKAAVEELLLAGPVSAGIVRPTLVFGGDNEILINNIAWFLRHSPVFVLPRRSGRVQPVSVRDVARLCVEAATGDARILDAVGPELYTYPELVHTIRGAVRSRALLVGVPDRAVTSLASAASVVLRDRVLTPEELAALNSSLLCSHAPASGGERFSEWLCDHAHGLGRFYHSELAQNWRGAG